MKHATVLIFLIALFLPAGAHCADPTAAALYTKGLSQFHKENYEGARETFGKLINLYPQCDYAPDAVFKVGESYYRQGQYEKSGSYFRLYLARFAVGKNAQDAKYRLSQCELKSDSPITAAHPRMESDKVPMQAVRIVRFHQRTLPAVERELSNLKRQGVNTIIVPALCLKNEESHGFIKQKAGTGAYFETAQIPVLQNILPALAATAHKYGLMIYAEVPVLSLPLGALDQNWDLIEKKIVATEKLDPFSQNGVERAKAFFEELSKVSLDGVVMTDLALAPDAGYSPEAMTAYELKIGKKPNPDLFFASAKRTRLGQLKYSLAPGYEQIASVKADRISELAYLLAMSTRAINPNMEVWVEVGDKALVAPDQGLLWASQDIDKLAKPPIYGVMFTLSLRQFALGEALTEDQRFASIGRLSKRAVTATVDPTRFLLIMEIEDSFLKKPIPDGDIFKALSSGRRAGFIGIGAQPLKAGFDYGKVFDTQPTTDTVPEEATIK